MGNGQMGCLLYGDNPLRLSVDRIDLWDTRPHPTTSEKDFNYQTLISLSKSEKKEDIKKRNHLFEKIYNELPYPSKITAGRIEISFLQKQNSVYSELDIEKGIAKSVYENASLEGFIHAKRPVGIFRIKGNFALKLHIPDYISEKGFNDSVTAGEGGNITPKDSMQYPKAQVRQENSFTYYIQKTKTDFSYGLFVYQIKKNEYTYIYFTVRTSEDAEHFEKQAKELLLHIADIDYSRLKKEHLSYWNHYYKKSNISIPDKLLEKTYYRSWYLFASTSRKGGFPMPLQGVWTADHDCLPPWKGDYHHDTNTQMSYQGYLKANHLNEGRCFPDYLWANREAYRRFARDFYGVKGLLIPGVSTIDGKPMGGWAHYSLSPTMSIWAAQSFDEYYLYTGSKTFLKQRAYPFFKEISTAILGLLAEKNGKLYLPLSSSPEIHNNSTSAYLAPNSNFDLSLMRYLFTKMIDYCSILKKDSTVYQNALSKLDDIFVIDGVISLSKDEALTESHRHFSHLMALYPLHLINYDSERNQRLYENSLKQIEDLGTENWVGFSFAMAAQIYAMAYNGDKAYENLFKFADGFVGENGFHLNGDFKNKGYSSYKYRPFTLEALFGCCDALQEMLLQQHNGFIHVFPSIPKSWEKERVSFSRLRTYNGLMISSAKQPHSLEFIELESNKTLNVKIKNTFNALKIKMEYNGTICEIADENGFFNLYSFKGKAKLFEEKEQA